MMAVPPKKSAFLQNITKKIVNRQEVNPFRIGTSFGSYWYAVEK